MIKSNVKKSDRTKWQKQIRLLSGGYTNPAVFPEGKATIKPWDNTVDEWALKNQSLDQTSLMVEATKRVLDVPADFDVTTMLYGDVSTILLVSRGLRVNCDYPIVPTCPECKHKHSTEHVRIPEDLRRIGEKPDGYPGYDDIVLPESKDQVQLRPLSVKDILTIEARDKAAQSVISTEVANTIWGVISVGGHENKPSSIDETHAWFRSLGPVDSMALVVARDDLDPHLSPSVDFQCDQCGADFSVTLTFNNNFFRRRVRELTTSALVQDLQPTSQ